MVRLPCGILLPFCFFVASVLCFTVLVLIPKVEQIDFLKSSIARRPRGSFGGETRAADSGSGLTSGEIQGSSGATKLEAPPKWRDFSDVNQELEQLMHVTTRRTTNHMIKEKLEKMLESSGSAPRSASAEVKFDYNQLSCTPQQNVLFLKTHKTGSSTMTNILNRYADVRELTVALPLSHMYRFEWPSFFQGASVDQRLLNGQFANIFSNHARYNRPAMELIMANNTKYITILRNPVDHFQSTFYYMEFHRLFHLSNHRDPLETFLSRPVDYLRDLMKGEHDFGNEIHLVRNGMFFDLGLRNIFYDNETAIRTTVKKIEQDFSLVLMTDHFDESLVLLKREFCWDFDDILYIKFNQRQSDNDTTKKPKKKLEDAIRRWNWADVLLYEHFYKVFWNKVRAHGEEFNKDLEEFRKRNREMYHECVSSDEVTETAFQLSGKIKGFKLNENVSRYNRYWCQKILTNEIDYMKYFRLKFNPFYVHREEVIEEILLAKGPREA